MNVDTTLVAQPSHFGTCPTCHAEPTWLNIGRTHWLVCHHHHVRWTIGENITSNWRDQTEATWDANHQQIADYTEVTPSTIAVTKTLIIDGTPLRPYADNPSKAPF